MKNLILLFIVLGGISPWVFGAPAPLSTSVKIEKDRWKEDLLKTEDGESQKAQLQVRLKKVMAELSIKEAQLDHYETASLRAQDNPSHVANKLRLQAEVRDLRAEEQRLNSALQ